MKVCTTCSSEYPDDQSFCPADGSALKSTSAAADLVGAIVADRYRILEKLGEGGMGTVYLAEHVKMGRMSAIKVISKSLTQDADAIARFNREAANASRINHPNVCAIYDFGETEDGVIYLAMEFIEGESLTDLINREGALAPKRAADIARQTAEALEAAHEFGIVHRDLKPDNIMITKTRGGLDLAKVVDFGIAKAAGGDEKQNVTKTGLVVGTPEYMSPEQLSGDAVDGRSDIYSLALVFFRMLTGTLPFQADTAQEVMIKRLTDEPLKLKDALPEGAFPVALQQIMDRALQRMPSDRYGSAAEFGADIAGTASAMADVAPALDLDGATQLIDPSKTDDGRAGPEAGAGAGTGTGATEVIPQTRVSQHARKAPTPDTPMMPPTAVAGRAAGEKKKAPVAAIAAVVGTLVIGGGSVAVVMSRGSSEPQAVDFSGQMAQDPVTQNTATDTGTGDGSRPEDTSPPPGGRQSLTETEPDNPPGNSGREMISAETEDSLITIPAPTNPAWMSPAGADDHLVEMLLSLSDASPQRLKAVLDTAILYYDGEGIAELDRATAAFLAAQAFGALGDRRNALTWAQRALDLDPGDAVYRTYVTDLQGGQRP
ncbi:MAG: serine/threonine protein kinase [Gemmatimonadetes bacterium]|nr:serine/threonine protein kinase [Gemmatimonadota bacterium]